VWLLFFFIRRCSPIRKPSLNEQKKLNALKAFLTIQLAKKRQHRKAAAKCLAKLKKEKQTQREKERERERECQEDKKRRGSHGNEKSI